MHIFSIMFQDIQFLKNDSIVGAIMSIFGYPFTSCEKYNNSCYICNEEGMSSSDRTD